MAESDMKPTQEWVLEQEMNKLVDLWGQVGLLKGIESQYDKGVMAVWLENARLANQLLPGADPEDEEYLRTLETYKRISIPVIRRLFDHMKSREWISFQPMLGPTGLAVVWKGDKFGDVPIQAYTRSLKSEYIVPEYRSNNLDVESELCWILAIELACEIDRAVLQSLREAAPVTSFNCRDSVAQPTMADMVKAVGDLITEKAKECRDKAGVPGQLWAVMGAEVFELFTKAKLMDEGSDDMWLSSLAVRRNAKDYGDIKVYVDPLFPPTQILVGLKADDPKISGYYFNPYVTTPLFKPKDKDAFAPQTKFSLLLRHAHVMPEGGSKFYHRISLENLMV